MKKANDYFIKGYSCSEAIIKAAIDKGLVHEDMLPLATAFSGGIGSGCLCGAVAGMEMVIGSMYGRDDKERDGRKARELGALSIKKFKEKNKVTCCKLLTIGFVCPSPERKQHCSKIVNDCVEIMEELLDLKKC